MHHLISEWIDANLLANSTFQRIIRLRLAHFQKRAALDLHAFVAVRFAEFRFHADVHKNPFLHRRCIFKS